MSSLFKLLQQNMCPFSKISGMASPVPPSPSPPYLALMIAQPSLLPGTTIIGQSYCTAIFTSSYTSGPMSAAKRQITLQSGWPFFLPMDSALHSPILNLTQPPHDRSPSGLLQSMRWECPLASSMLSTVVGLILGYFIYFSGATPISFTFLRRQNFQTPEARPLSTITASVLKQALTTPAQNLPRLHGPAPITLTTGKAQFSLSLFKMSEQGKFFLQIFLILTSLASFPPGNRKSKAFQISSLSLSLSFLSLESALGSTLGLSSCWGQVVGELMAGSS